MCGIAGKLLFDPAATVDPVLLDRMARAIAHRGPDDQGTWTDGPIGLANRRLAVIDLSPRGHQPMSSADGRLHVTYNGEIYNFQSLRAELQRGGVRFRSDTDTEVLLALYERDGPHMVQRLRGMFAFALWDAPRRRLFLARDRLGKKPLFYYQDDRRFVFGSEPKAVLQDPEVPAEPDEDALSLYLGLGYVPAPWSAFRGMRKLPPAHFAIVENGRLRLERYWHLRYEPKRQEAEDALIDELRERLREAVRLRLISDVPVGALLSGGIDSSVVVALMCHEHSGPVKTFSIGFDESRYDETAHAATVARHLGTDHRELIVRPDATSMLNRLVWHYNEPFADSSALPTMAVAALARTEVTVALNGDGGDEAFVGYERYLALDAAGRLDALPQSARRLMAAGTALLPAGEPKTWSYRVRRFGATLADSPFERFASWSSVFDAAMRRRLTRGRFTAASENLLSPFFVDGEGARPVEAAVRADVHLYLPDDLLVKMDIASMAHSLEVRSPFLDHEIVEFAASLPLSLKLRGKTLKYLLRKAFADLLPSAILARPKMGFGVPIDRWFRNELRELAYDVLLDSRAVGRGYFEPAELHRYLDEHSSGRAHHHHRLWALLILELWHRLFIDRRCTVEPPSDSGSTESAPQIDAAAVHASP
jgi:asparagine synthase (glutamine-hydrolysing)